MYEVLDRRYALALYEVAQKKGKVEEYLGDLEQIVDLVKSNAEFSQIIEHPQISSSERKEIFTNIFKDKVDQGMLSFLLLLIDKDRILNIADILEAIKVIHLEKNDTVTAVVKTVIPLNDDERQLLKNKLQDKYSKKIILSEEIDKDVIGGVYLKVGNDVIDGTIKSKLDEMRKLMLKSE